MASLMEIMQSCRLCLVKDQANIPIFEEQGDIRQIFLKISACLPVKVSREDNLPKKICDGCSYKLEMVYDFWNTSANSEKQLLKWLEQVGIDKLPTPSDKSTQPQSHSINSDGVILKQEVLDLGEMHGDDDELPTDDLNVPTDPEYLLQQQSYQSFEFQTDGFNEGETASAAGPSSTITSEAAASAPPKRKRRAAAMKPLPPQSDSEDEDDTGLIEPKIAKTEEQSDESAGEDPEPTTFVGLPADDEQPGPSGVGKAATGSDAPLNLHHQQSSSEVSSRINPSEHAVNAETSNSKSKRIVKLEERQFHLQWNDSNTTERIQVMVPRVIVSSLPSTNQEVKDLPTSNTRSYQISNTESLSVATGSTIGNPLHMQSSPGIPAKVSDTHLASVTPFKKQKMNGCSFCGALFMQRHQVKTHQKMFHKELQQAKNVGKMRATRTKSNKLSDIRHRELLKFVETATSNDGRFWYKCKECFGLFQLEKVLLAHIEDFHCKTNKAPEEEYKCLLCEVVHKLKPALDLHMKVFHTAPDGKWKCRCGRLYANEKPFQRHITKYTYNHFACPYCYRFVRNELQLDEHLQTHEHNRFFNVCKNCYKGFHTATQLKKHLCLYEQSDCNDQKEIVQPAVRNLAEGEHMDVSKEGGLGIKVKNMAQLI